MKENDYHPRSFEQQYNKFEIVSNSFKTSSMGVKKHVFKPVLSTFSHTRLV